MPTIIVRRFPLPSVSIYLILSISLLCLSIMWANNTLVEEQELLGNNKSNIETKDDIETNPLLAPESDDKETEEINNIEGTTHKKTREVGEVWSYPKPTDGNSKPESSITFSIKRDSKNPTDEPFVGTEIARSVTAGNYSFAYGVFELMLDEPLCLMLVVNATYCVLVVIMHIIQKIVFGKLRPIERQHIKDKFWNFVFYKFIFIFGVMNVQSLNEVLVWVSWFTAIAFLLLLTKLSKDRFEFLSFSPNTPMFYHWKVVGLLNFILLCCILLAVLCVTSTFPFSSSPSANYDIHSITFMLAECVIIAVKAVHVMARYGIHLYDVRHAELWERKATVVYHVDLTMELLSLFVNFVHHLHMLFSGNIWLSMASLVICMQLRFIFSEIQKRYLRHKNYRRVVANMDAQFPAATREEIDQHEDRCAICWDQMESARKLPCGHLFHAACLRSWLEQDTTCPTCRLVVCVDENRLTGVAAKLAMHRKQLGIRQNGQHDGEDVLPEDEGDDVDGRPGGVPNPAGGGLPNAGGGAPQRNHFWHFDGTRIASWLPSFSVEVTHSPHGAQAMVTTTSQISQEISNSQLDTMVRDVQDIFPQIPARVIANDLRRTGSTEQTTLNILEGNVAVPPDQMVPAQQAPTPPENNRSDFQLPTVTRSQPFFSTTLRRRNVSSVSESQLPRAQTRTTTAANPLPGMFVPPPTNSTPPVAEDTSGNPGSSRATSPAVFGRFSKAPEEREVVLRNRRDLLLRQARRKYLDRGQPKQSETDSSTATSDQVVPPHPHGSRSTNPAWQASSDELPGSSGTTYPSEDNRLASSTASSPISSAGIPPPQSGQVEGRGVSFGNVSNNEIIDDPLD